MCAWKEISMFKIVFCSSYSTIHVHYSKSYLDIGKVQVANTKREAEPTKE